MIQHQKKGKRNASMTSKQLWEILQREGFEKITIWPATKGLKVPRPLHTEFRTRQMVLYPNINTGVTSGGGTQNSYIAQTAPGTSVFGSMAFSLQDLDQVTQFAAICDQYRIDRVVAQIRTRNNTANFNSASAANGTPPSIYLVIDRDDSTAPTTYAQLRQYDNVQEASVYDNIEIDLEPSITPAVYASGAFSGYGVQRTGVWLDVNNVSIPHYGVKFGITELTALDTLTYYWDVIFWYYVSFRNVR